MKTRHALAASLALSLTLACASAARAQGEDKDDDESRADAPKMADAPKITEAPKIEVGAQLTSLTLLRPDGFGAENQSGFGGRFTYNFNKHLAAEGELNFLPTRLFPDTAAGGRTVQGQFGLKVGKRFERFGVFAKARPGFVRLGDVLRITRGQITIFGNPIPFNFFTLKGRTYFSMDVGGVIEIYPSRRVVVRFDAGDTIVRYGARTETIDGPVVFEPRDFRPVVRTPAETKHNFQFTAGLAFRFRGGDEPEARDAAASPSRAPRYEVGAQFSSIHFTAPDRSALRRFFPAFFLSDTSANTEAGFGGRVTFNLNEHVGVEAEGNFYPRESFADETSGGFPAQLQAGVKVGRRFRRFGVFAKARPGFVTFSRVRQHVGSDFRTFRFAGELMTIDFGIFADRRRTYFSTDVGGVFEFYHSRRVMTRVDVGDTVIRYGQRPAQTFHLLQPIVVLPAETKHNFQFTAGLAFRF